MLLPCLIPYHRIGSLPSCHFALLCITLRHSMCKLVRGGYF
nr:MAG TPA: hypothetical protein [Caudoviricetes sp.]